MRFLQAAIVALIAIAATTTNAQNVRGAEGDDAADANDGNLVQRDLHKVGTRGAGPRAHHGRADPRTTVITSPSEIWSSGGTLSTTISIEQATYTIPGTDFSVNARLLNGEYPGPTLRIQPGDTLKINFQNNLVDLGSAHVNNEYSGNDISNMHFHGLHVSGELPSDDVTHKVYPGESYNYETTLPDEHMGGTHWQHPHVHGSTSLQVAGGALQTIIVEDPDGFLPGLIANAQEVLFIAHYWHLFTLENIVSQSGDTVFSTTMTNQQRQSFMEFVTVNGQYQPEISIDAGQWFRMRVVWANFREGDLDLGIDGCEMYLLAKDGIYIQDFPRLITDAVVVPGGRADIMVRCPTASTTYTINGIVDGMATIVTTSKTRNSPDLPSWTPTYPDYLTDLTTQTVSDGCDCDTLLSGATMSVNNIPFPDDGSYLHETYLGAIASRTLTANTHPYHQHVYPFQIVGETMVTGYNQIGDWHDTIKGSGEVRFRPTQFTGKMMLHCHRLIHEDLGMMAMEYVGTAEEGTCSCTSRMGTLR